MRIQMARQEILPLGKRLIPVASRLYKEMREDDVLGMAAELAFRLFLALFPFFIFLAALGGFVAELLGVANPTDEIINLFGGSLPADTESVLRTQIDSVISNRNAGLLSIGVLGALFAASGGVGTLMKASNRAYSVHETRPVLKRYALSVVLTLLGGLLLIAAFALVLAGQVYGSDLADKLGVGGFAGDVVSLARWPTVVVLALMATAVLYWATPSKELPFRMVTPGALLFVSGWLAVSYFFGAYVANFGSYNATYGTLGGVAITLTWFYITSAILLAGIEVNAVLDSEAMHQTEASSFE